MAKFGFNTAEYRSAAGGPQLQLVDEDTLQDHPELGDTLLDYALRYADIGWYVIPVRADKKPLPGYGLSSATRDPAVVRNIWTQHPEANIAVACERSGLVVLDVDPRNGGAESLAALEATHGVIHSAVTARTQGGGEHRVFRASAGARYPGTLGPGLDLKHHGYVVVAPSKGPSGRYEWLPGRDPTSGTLPTEAPPLLRAAAEPSGGNDYSVTHAPGSIVVAPEVYTDLERALAAVPPELPYDEGWFRVLQGLSRLADAPRAHAIAKQWSLRSTRPGHTAEAFESKWRGCLREAYSVSHLSVFHLADRHAPGWRSAAPAAEPSTAGAEPHPLSLERAAGAGAEQVVPFEYLLDDFMSTGVNVIAGAPGVGKTTLVIPLALACAHLCPADYALKPQIRRNVIIITESVVQVQRTVYSVFAWGGTGLPAAEFERRVRVIAAQRLEPRVVARVAAEYRAWTVPNPRADGAQYAALPLVVFDTANAVFDLENENDNAEVGRALAIVKQAFADFPLLIISHAAKAAGTAESDTLSPRGAGAWAGDAQGVYTVFKDGDAADSPRVLKVQKVRFPTAFAELTFDLVQRREQHPDVLGYPRDVWFSHSTARPLKPGERAQLKTDAKEQKELEDWVRLCDEIIDLVRQDPGHARSYYEQLPAARGGVRGSQPRKERAVESLLNDGSLERVELEAPRGRANHYLRVNEEVAAAHERSRYALNR